MTEPARPSLSPAPDRRLEAGLWLLFAILGVAPALLRPGHVVGDGVDAFGTHWFYWFMRRCMETFSDPSWTDLFFYPDGKQIFAHTGNNLVDAVLSVPFQYVFGPELYQPVFIVVVLVGNAVAFRPLAREVLGEGFGAFAATLLWSINPFLLFEVTAGRPTQAFVWYLPVALWAFLRCARGGGWKDAAVLGVATGLTGWSYWFNGYFLALAFAVLLPFELRASPDRRAALARWAVGALVCAAIVAPGVVWMAAEAGAGNVPGLAATGGGNAPRPATANVANTLHGLYLMEVHGAPLLGNPAWGIPLVVAALWPRVTIAGRAAWIALVAVFVAFAFGPAVVLDNGTPLTFPWYVAAQTFVPFFDRLWFPYRMMVVTFAAASLLIGGWLGAALSARRAPFALAALVALGLAGQAYVYVWPFNTHDPRPPAMLETLRSEGGGLIYVPFRVQHDGLMWQTRIGLPTFGGMGESASLFWEKPFRARLNNPFIRAVRGAAMLPAARVTFDPRHREEIERLGFRWIVLRIDLVQQEILRQAELHDLDAPTGPTTLAAAENISRVVGSPPVGLDQTALLWDLRGAWTPSNPAWTPTDEAIATVRVTSQIGAGYELRARALGRDQAPKVNNRPQTGH